MEIQDSPQWKFEKSRNTVYGCCFSVKQMLKHKMTRVKTLISKMLHLKNHMITNQIKLHTIPEEIKRILLAHSKSRKRF